MPATGIDRNLTHYADPGFSRYLRRAFLASAGYDEADLERPVVGIADTSSDYTPAIAPCPSSWKPSNAACFICPNPLWILWFQCRLAV